MLGLIALLQTAPTAVPPVPEKFSILLPACAPAAPEADILVCGAREGSARLPLPDDRGPPDHGVPSNPHRTGVGALAATNTPCAATQWGCEVGFGPPIMPIVNAAVGLMKSALAKRPDKTGRVAIPLDDPPPPPLQP